MTGRLSLKRRIGRLVGRPAAPATSRTVVLLYHSIGGAQWAVSEALFRDQVAWLSEHASLVPLSQALEPPTGAGLRVALTFDDGYAPVHDLAAPVLARHGAPATVFLNTGWIGGGARKASDASLGHFAGEHFMTWREASALASAGWTLGSHGVEHLDLTRQPDERVVHELARSKQDIEDRVAGPCEHFAFPWGRFTRGLQRRVEQAGYASAASGLHGPVPAAADRFALPRIDIRAEYDLADFQDAVTGRWDFLGFKQRLGRAFA